MLRLQLSLVRFEEEQAGKALGCVGGSVAVQGAELWAVASHQCGAVEQRDAAWVRWTDGRLEYKE